MGTKSGGASALLCFLSVCLFGQISPMDLSTKLNKFKIEKTKNGLDFSSRPYSNIDNGLNYTTSEEHFRNSSFSTQNHDAIEHNNDRIDNEPCKDDFTKQLKGFSDNEWIINSTTLKLLENDPQQLIECTNPGDRVFFTLSGMNTFNRTLIVDHELELIGQSPSQTNNLNLRRNNNYFTCPDSSPFLNVKSTNVTISGFVILECSNLSGIGVVVVEKGSNVVLNEVNFSKNNISTIYASSNTKLDINNSYFAQNHIENKGGVIYGPKKVSLKISNCTFKENKAIFGGCIYGKNNVSLAIEGSFFTKNNSTDKGGAILTKLSSSITIVNSTLEGNFALGKGGAIYVQEKSTIAIRDSTFKDNNATAGGAMMVCNQNNVSMTNTKMFANNASKNGGAILSLHSNVLNFANATFRGNNATGNGGAIRTMEENNIIIVGAMFSGNKVKRTGGAMALAANSTLTIVNTTFIKNNATWFGGALRIDSFCTINITHSKFTGHEAQLGGVFFMEKDSKFTISRSEISKNHAFKGGGFFADINTTIRIEQCKCIKNDANQGGCFYGDGSALNVHNFDCIENLSTQYGGCFHLEACDGFLKSNNISQNNAMESGGGIYVSTRAFMHVEDTYLGLNIARNGGGISLVLNSRIFCLNCLIDNNTATHGGGLYIESNSEQILTAQFTNSTFQKNIADDYGAGMVVKTFGINALKCENVLMPCDRILLLNTNFSSNFARKSHPILIATNLDNILIGCNISVSDTYMWTFFDRTTVQWWLDINYLKVLSREELCSSWKNNSILNDTHSNSIGTFGWRINLAINTNNESRLVGDDKFGFEINNITSGKPIPNIVLSTIDALNMSNAPTLYEQDAIKLVPLNDFLKQPVGFSFNNRECKIQGVVGYVVHGKYNITITPREDDILKAVNLTLIVRECFINEESLMNGLLCQGCGVLQYNFNGSNSGGCQKCPKNAICKGRFVIPENGYWHKSGCHDKVKKCIVDKACKFSNRVRNLEDFMQNFTRCNMNQSSIEEYANNQCYTGYTGPLCGSCKNSYGLSSSFECAKCGLVVLSLLKMIASVCYLLFGTSLTIKGILPLASSQQTNQTNQNEETPLLEANNQPIESASNNQTRTGNEGAILSSQLEIVPEASASLYATHQEEDIEIIKQHLTEAFKVLLNFFQVISTAMVMDVKWTKIILRLLQKLEVLGAATVNAVSGPIDCLFSSKSNATRDIWRTLFSILSPTIVIAILAIYWGYRAYKFHRVEGFYFKRRLTMTIVIVTYITYFDLTQIAVRVFNCVWVHDSVDYLSNATTSYWIEDTSIECYKDTHFVLIGIALVVIILVSICFPLFCSISLFKNRDEALTPRSWTHDTLGFLCGPFKQRFIYWECITMIKKALLSIIIVFSYSLGNHVQGLLILLVLVFFLYIHFACCPYDEKYGSLNYYESVSLLVSCVTYTLIQFFNIPNCSEVNRTIVSVALIAINSGFVCLMVYKIIKELIRLVRSFLHSKNIHIHGGMNLFNLIKAYYAHRKALSHST